MKNKISISSGLVLKWSVFFFFVELDLCDCLSLFLQLLALFQVSFSHLFEVLIEKHFSLLTVFSLFSLLEDVLDMLFKLVWMTNVNELQCVFNCNAPSASDIIHQELSQVEEISRFEPGLIENAALVHECEFVFIYRAIEVFIDFPDPLIDFGLAEGEVELCQDSDDVFLIELFFGSKGFRLNGYGLRLMVYYWAGLKVPLVASTLSPQMRLKVLRSLSASMFWIYIS